MQVHQVGRSQRLRELDVSHLRMAVLAVSIHLHEALMYQGVSWRGTRIRAS